MGAGVSVLALIVSAGLAWAGPRAGSKPSAGSQSAASPQPAARPTVDWAALPDPALLAGGELADAAVEGKVVLLVNVASRCGFTPQYAGLQELWTRYRHEGLVVLGAPCNQFGGQEPGSADEIQSFCRTEFGVGFPLLQKQDVNGAERSPLYAAALGSGRDVAWNFEKVLIGRDGTVLGRFDSSVAPDSPRLRAAVEAALSH